MADTVNLTIKIDPALKERIKQLALESQISMSQEVTQRLQASLQAQPHPAVDSLGTQEDTPAPLTSAEVKQIRSLLKKNRKKK